MDKLFNIDDINKLSDIEITDILDNLDNINIDLDDQSDNAKDNLDDGNFDDLSNNRNINNNKNKNNNINNINNKQKKKIYNKDDDKDICSNCERENTIIEDKNSGVIVCKQCGYVQEMIIDDAPEWKFYDDDPKGDGGRCGMPICPLLPQSSLGTIISGGNGFYQSRLQKIQSWNNMPYSERSRCAVLKEISFRCKKGGILKCIEDDAKIMYKNISDCNHITRGDNRKSLIASCVFFACKKNGKTRTPKEIGDLFELDFSDVTKGCKKFNALNNLTKMNLAINVSTPEHFINRFGNDLKLKRQYIEDAIKIAKNIKKLNIASVHTPISIATGSILLVSDINNLEISRKLIANQFAISEVTVFKAYKKIEKYKKALTNNDLTDKIVCVMKHNINSVIPEHVKRRMEALKITDNDIKTTFPSYNKYEQYEHKTITRNEKSNVFFKKTIYEEKTFVESYYDIVRQYHTIDKEIQKLDIKFEKYKTLFGVWI